MPQPLLFRIIDKAVFEYNMIENGDRILVGASGGKDSTSLVEYFAARQRQHREQFEFTALHIAAEISPPFSRDLAERFKSLDVPFVRIPVDVIERLKPGRKMNCWWCTTQRRTELNNYAVAHGYNKIALGHHMDDILETLLMNALGKGELSTMPPRLKYSKYPVTIIRPLCFADTDTILSYARSSGFSSSVCTCCYQDNSGRKDARRRLQLLTRGSMAEKRRLFDALRNVKTEYLP